MANKKYVTPGKAATVVKPKAQTPGAQSQVRAGIAKKALQNTKQWGDLNLPKGNTKTNPAAWTSVQPVSQPSSIIANLAKTQQTASNPSSPQTDTPAASPTVDRTPTGQLTLPYNGELAMSILQAQQQSQEGLLSLDEQAANQALQFNQMMRDAGIQYKDTQRGNLNNHAARGMAYTSGYAHRYEREGSDHTRYTTDLQASNDEFNTQIGNRRRMIEQALEKYITEANAAYAASLENQAGDLGLGDQPKPNPTKPPGDHAGKIPGATKSQQKAIDAAKTVSLKTAIKAATPQKKTKTKATPQKKAANVAANLALKTAIKAAKPKAKSKTKPKSKK